MSRYIASRAIRGAHLLVNEAEGLLTQALAELGPDTPVAFPNTAYYLPTINGMMGVQVETLGQLEPVLEHARGLLHPMPADTRWMPYLGETLDSGMATLFAAEAIEALRFIKGEEPQRIPGFHMTGGSFTSPDHSANGDGANGYLNGPIDDVQLRSWGIQLVDGRMPGFAAIVGAAKSNEVAVKIVRELQRRNILIFLSGNVNGRSIIHQLQEEGVEMGYDTYIVPFGLDTLSAIYALGFATRSALTFGGLKAGQAREILLYNRARVFAFVLALGEIDDLKYAAAAGAINYGFPVIADTIIPQILPTGVTQHEHVVSLPFNTIHGKDDLERAEKLVQKCIETRGVKIKITEVPVPVPYGSAFEGEVVRKKDMRVEFGGKYSRAFEYLRMVPAEQVEDGHIEIIGPDFADLEEGDAMDMAIIVEVAGRKMQTDFEPVLERQIHYFVNAASGIQHIGQRDIAWIRISKAAADKGFGLKHFGDIMHARFHGEFGAIVDKVQVKIITDPALHAEWLERARNAYNERNERMGNLKDDAVPEFYTCTLCQSFAPTHVCIVSPERLGLCGAYNWLDCKASFEINPTGPNQPIQLGDTIDPVKGYWTGTNDVAVRNSQGTVHEVAMYSIMENPMTACLTADAEVLVNGRVVRIGDFVEAQQGQPANVQLSSLSDAGKLASSKLLGVHKNPAPEQLMRIQTKSGLTLTLTPNHEVAVDRRDFDGNGQGPWVRADELRVGDAVYALKQLRLEGKTPATIDLLPDDCRVADQVLLANIETRLRVRYGSQSAAYRALNLPKPDPRVSSMPVGSLRQIIEALELDWNEFKGQINLVTSPTGHPVWSLPQITPDLLYLLGLIASDGSLQRTDRTQCRVNFTNSDEALLTTYAEIYRRLFPQATLGWRQKTGGGMIDGRQITASEPSTDLYSNNFILGLVADALGVRMAGDVDVAWDLARLVSLPETHIAAFLAGVFDGDGSVRLRHYDDKWPVGEAYLSHSDLQAARHLQLLLKRLDIVGQLRPDRTVYKVEMHGGNLRRFAELIPGRHPAKRATLDQIAALPKNGPDKAQSEVLPYAAGKALAQLPESQIVLSPSTRFYYETGRSRPVADQARLLMDETPEAATALSPYLEGDTFLDTITKLEAIQNDGQYAHVFNLSLLDINSYLANGIHVKNCGCFECIVMLVPEANGVMVVSREDTSMTPAGMTFSTLAGMAGGGLQTPGVMGVGKYYLTSPKFISADGGFKRIVWMSSVLKKTMAEEFKAVAEREGDPDLLDKIADETICTDVDGLLAWMEEHEHPALFMDPIF